MAKIYSQCTSIYLSEVILVVNCNRIFHLEDLLSETEKVALKRSQSGQATQERPHSIGNSTMLSSAYCSHIPNNTKISPQS